MEQRAVKTLRVRARMMPDYKVTKTDTPVGKRTVVRQDGLLGKRRKVQETVYEELRKDPGKYLVDTPDYEDLGSRIEDGCDRLEEGGFRVISAMSVRSGQFFHGSGMGYGFGVTRGAIITGRRDMSTPLGQLEEHP